MSAGKGDKNRTSNYKKYYENINLLDSLPVKDQKPIPSSTCVEVKRLKNKVVYVYKNT